MASEVYPSASEVHTERTDVFQLEALSLNFLRSISKIPDDVEIPKLKPCKLCDKNIPTFRFQEFTVLSCGHILHRTCLEKHYIRFPTCPTCPTTIEIIREELVLASGEYDIVLKNQDLGKKASQRSDITIEDEDELEVLSTLGSSNQSIPDNSTCNRATSPIVIEDISTTPENSGNQANENLGRVTSPDKSSNVYVEQDFTKGSKPSNSEDQTNDTTKTRSSRQSSPKIDRDRDKLQSLTRTIHTNQRRD
ncbi:9623_t:CDS:2 [Ambispora leptoticha]|uniref:9623_t:CDS:1 n=1 Tax=Ambispora leptoticha TaxID=144679 RepID=A0A9N9BDB9_9GLOM|nr:9623_t:CDS:2 [Ambispora leptoticha]